MSVKISDPLFGVLRYDSFWEGQVTLPAFNQDAELQIVADSNGPDDRQREAFRWLLANQHVLISAIEHALANYCRRLIAEGELPAISAEPPPVLDKDADIWPYLSDMTVSILIQHDRLPRVAFAWVSELDIEHGLEVLIERGMIANVGGWGFE